MQLKKWKPTRAQQKTVQEDIRRLIGYFPVLSYLPITFFEPEDEKEKKTWAASVLYKKTKNGYVYNLIITPKYFEFLTQGRLTLLAHEALHIYWRHNTHRPKLRTDLSLRQQDLLWNIAVDIIVNDFLTTLYTAPGFPRILATPESLGLVTYDILNNFDLKGCEYEYTTAYELYHLFCEKFKKKPPSDPSFERAIKTIQSKQDIKIGNEHWQAVGHESNTNTKKDLSLNKNVTSTHGKGCGHSEIKFSLETFTPLSPIMPPLLLELFDSYLNRNVSDSHLYLSQLQPLFAAINRHLEYGEREAPVVRLIPDRRRPDLPVSLHYRSHPSLLVIVDSSGSMESADIDVAKQILKLWFDRGWKLLAAHGGEYLRAVTPITQKEYIKTFCPPYGSGGTSYKKVFESFEKPKPMFQQARNAEFIVYITDGECSWYPEPSMVKRLFPHYRQVLWVILTRGPYNHTLAGRHYSKTLHREATKLGPVLVFDIRNMKHELYLPHKPVEL